MKPRLSSLLRTIEQLGESRDGTADIDVVRLAGYLAREICADLAPTLLTLLQHPNPNARRATLIAVRRAGWWSNREIVRAVVDCLSDATPSVRLDAALALGSSGLSAPLVVDALRRLARDASPGDTFDFDDHAQQARVQAAMALAGLVPPERKS